MTDSACIHGIVATGLSQLSMLKSRSLSPTPPQEAADILEESSQHFFEAVHLLNKKFENPKEALSLTSLFGLSILALASVRPHSV